MKNPLITILLLGFASTNCLASTNTNSSDKITTLSNKVVLEGGVFYPADIALTNNFYQGAWYSSLPATGTNAFYKQAIDNEAVAQSWGYTSLQAMANEEGYGNIPALLEDYGGSLALYAAEAGMQYAAAPITNAAQKASIISAINKGTIDTNDLVTLINGGTGTYNNGTQGLIAATQDGEFTQTVLKALLNSGQTNNAKELYLATTKQLRSDSPATKIDWSKWDTTGQTLTSVGFDLAAANLTPTQLGNFSSMDNVSLGTMDLAGVILPPTVKGVDLSNVRNFNATALSNTTDLSGSNLSNKDLTGWVPTSVNLNFSIVTAAQIAQIASVDGANIASMNLTETGISKAMLSSALLAAGKSDAYVANNSTIPILAIQRQPHALPPPPSMTPYVP
jgi:hypothetical protein